MEGEALVPPEPLDDLGMLVGRIVVEHDMDLLAGRHLILDDVQEADELLVGVALHAPADDAAFEHVEGGKQCGSAVPLIVVRHCAAASLLQRQTRLGAVERLDLAFLVHRQHDGMLRRVDVEAHDVAYFGCELRIVGQLELPYLMRTQAMATPDAMHRTDADPTCRGDGRRRPVRDLARRLGQRQRHHALCDRVSKRRDARRASLVDQQSVRARFHEAPLPAPDARLGLAGRAHDLGRADTLGRQQHDLGAPDVLLWTVPICRDGGKTAMVGGTELERDTGAHAADSHAAQPAGIPRGTLVSGVIH